LCKRCQSACQSWMSTLPLLVHSVEEPQLVEALVEVTLELVQVLGQTRGLEQARLTTVLGMVKSPEPVLGQLELVMVTGLVPERCQT
jgi:hypothetical protein